MNSFGRLFRFTSWGESHGPAIGCVVDGMPPGLPLAAADIQAAMARRRTGQSRYTTQRREPDLVKIMSGVYEGQTTGTPIALVIDNVDQRARDYDEIAQKYRPGHADYSYDVKYGLRDPRGGGRASARETATRVAAGALATRLLTARADDRLRIRGAMIQLGPEGIDRSRWDWDAVEDNPFRCPDPGAVARWQACLDGIRKAGSSCGAVIEIVAEHVPPGLGEPVYGKLDAALAGAMMSINAVKAVEIGAGFAAAALRGEENADAMLPGPDGPRFASNHAGGILGGISTGQDIVLRFAVKPTSSILTPVRTVDRSGSATTIMTRGRHDPCVGIRAVPVGEAMTAMVLADHFLRHRAQCGDRSPAPRPVSGLT